MVVSKSWWFSDSMCSRTTASRSSRSSLAAALGAEADTPDFSHSQPSAAPASHASAQAVHAAQLLDGLVEPAERLGGPFAEEQLGIEAVTDELAGDGVHTLGVGSGTGPPRPLRPLPGVHQPDAVVGPPPAGKLAAARGGQPHGQALGLA